MDRTDLAGVNDRPWARRNPGLTFSPAAPAAPTPDATTSTDPFGMFSDPSTNFLTQIIKGQLGSLSSAPTSDPTTAWLMPYLTGQIAKLSSSPAPTFSAANPLLGTFTDEATRRIAELNSAPFNAGEEAAMRARTRNDTALQRDVAKQRIMEDASRRGVGQTSGVVSAELADLEGHTTAQDAKNQNDLLLWEADQGQQRKNMAAQIAQSLAAAGQTDAAMRLQAQQASESASQNRQSQVMGIATTLATMAAQQRGEARARQGDVLQLATLLAELPVQRLQLAANLLNGTGGNNVGSIFGDLTQLNTAQQNAQNQQNGAQGQWLSALSALASYFANKK